MSILEAKGIEKIYNQGKSSEVKALKQVDLSIDQGNWVRIGKINPPSHFGTSG